MAILIAAVIAAAVMCALAVLVVLTAMRVDAIRRAQDEGFPEAFGDWPNVPEHSITFPLHLSHVHEDGTVIDDTGREVFTAVSIHVAAALVARVNRDAGFVLESGRALL